MLHIKDKSLFSLKILSFEYIKLKLENPEYQEIIHSPEYKNEAYSYHVLERVADIDDSFEQIKTSPVTRSHEQPEDFHQLVERCYLLVGTAIGMQDNELQPGLSQDAVRFALRQYPASITSGLKKIESVAKRCHTKSCSGKFILDKAHKLNKAEPQHQLTYCCINDLHQSVADLQLSLQDVFSMKLQRIH